MARKSAPRTPTRSYVTVFESEGTKWGESHEAEDLRSAELCADLQAHTRGLRVIHTLPLNPEV